MAYVDTVLADAPVGYWRLGDTSGTTATDASGSGRHGSYAGGYTLAQPGIRPGAPATLFNGTSGYVSVPHDPVFNLTGDFTLEAWVFPTGYPTYSFLFTKTVAGGAANDTFDLQLRTDGVPQFVQQNAGGQQIITCTAGLPTGYWSHLAVTRSGGTLTFYKNGKLASSGAIATTGVTTNTLPVYIGTRDDRYGYLAGRVDEAAIYTTALSAARVNAHFEAGAPYRIMVFTDVPAAYWPLDEASGGTASDISGNGRIASYLGLAGGHAYAQPSGVYDGVASHGIANASFNTTGPYIDCGYGAPYANPTAFTLEAWVYTTQPTNQNEGAQIIGCHNNASRGYTVLMDARAGNTQPFKLHYRMLDSAQVVQGVNTYALQRWHHIVATYDGTTYALYGDGVLDASAARTAGPGDCTVNNHFCLGSVAVGWGGPAGFNGRIEEAAFYTTALSASRVLAHYQAGLASNHQRWTGSAWTPAQVRRWDGTEWLAVWPKRWDGTAWT